MRRLILVSLLVLPFAVHAIEDEAPPRLEQVPDVPEPPKAVKSGETLEPDITIVRKGKKTIQEYRRGGRLYMVKVIPDVGLPYYLRDTDGDGKMDVRSNQLDRGAEVNMWNVLEW
ncbi:MAG: DUF2782 domain-containing protein [Methylococcales bacterium]|nr:DUF2782 domain-containing protein [Methylococcales bacterium]